jgi:hypothetical protein
MKINFKPTTCWRIKLKKKTPKKIQSKEKKLEDGILKPKELWVGQPWKLSTES